MSIRHKAYKTTLDRGYASEWIDDHIHYFGVELMDNLLYLGPDVTLNWDTSQTSGGNVPVWDFVGVHVFVVFDSGGTTNFTSSISHMLGGSASDITHPDDLPILTCALQIAAGYEGAGAANSIIEFGFQMSGDPIFTLNQHHAIFRVYNGKIHAVTGDGAAETVTEIADYNEYEHYRIEFTSASVKFYVGNMVTAAAVHTTHLPNDTLTVKFSVRSKNNEATRINLDGAGLTRLRKQ